MNAIKENLPAVAIGVGAALIAGYIAFVLPDKEKKQKKSIQEDEPQLITEETDDFSDLKNFHFLSANLSAQEREAYMAKWVQRQVRRLLARVEQINAPGGIITESQFEQVCHIVETRIRAMQQDRRDDKRQARIRVASEAGFDGDAYLDMVVDDVKHLQFIRKGDLGSVLKELGVSQFNYENSIEHYASADITVDLIHKFVNFFLFSAFESPNPSESKCDQPTAMQILGQATELFYSAKMKEFVFSKELDFVSYFDCYDTVTVDMAVSRQIPEADFRQAKRDIIEREGALTANWQKMVNFLLSLNEEADQQQAEQTQQPADPLEETQLPGVQLGESIEVTQAAHQPESEAQNVDRIVEAQPKEEVKEEPVPVVEAPKEESKPVEVTKEEPVHEPEQVEAQKEEPKPVEIVKEEPQPAEIQNEEPVQVLQEDPKPADLPKEEPKAEVPEEPVAAESTQVEEPKAAEAEPELETKATVAATQEDSVAEEQPVLEETKEEVPAAKQDEDAQSTATVTTAATEQTESAPVQSEAPEKQEVVTEVKKKNNKKGKRK